MDRWITEDLNERLSQQLFIGWWEIDLDVVGMIEIDWLMGWLLETKMNLYWALYGKLDPNSHVPYNLTSIEKSLIYSLVLSTHYSQEPDSFHPVYEGNTLIKRCHLAGEQALHLGESREFTREPGTRNETRARGMSSFTACFARHLPVQTEWKKWCSKWSLGRLRGLRKWSLHFWAQLFEGRLALNRGLNLTRVSFSYVQKHFRG